MMTCPPFPSDLASYDDVPTAEQLAAIEELVGQVDETDYEDIRPQRW